MAGGAGNIGSAGGMGNASAQPQGGPFGGSMGGGQQSGGGVPSFAQPYMNNLGGGMGGGQQSSGFGPGVNNFGGGSPFGMQQQQPMQNPFGGQQLGPNQSPGYGAAEFQQQQRGVLGQGGQQMGQQQGPIRQDMSSMGQLGAANQMPEPMGQRPAFLDNPDFQAYQKQEQDLGRQMNEYMQKAPMYQQMQELQGKMRGFQQPQQGQMGQMGRMSMDMPQQGQMGDTGFNRPMPNGQQFDQRRMAELANDDSGMGRGPRMGGGFGRRGMGGGYGQQMPQQAMGLQGLYSMLQGRRGGFGGQQPQAMQQAPQGMEMRRGMGGSYYVPAGTPYDPAMD